MSKTTVQILLKENISQLGKAGNLESVKAGYARNYLIPKKLAVPVTAGIIKQANRLIEFEHKKQAEIERLAIETKQLFQQIGKITLKKKIGKQSAIFGTVTDREVSQLLSNILGKAIDKKHIQLPEIKGTGLYSIQIKLYPGLIAEAELHLLPTTILN